MSDFRTPPADEPGPQPDPMLEPGRPSHAWKWAIGFAVLAVVVGTVYALNTPAPQTTASDSSPPQTTGQSNAPQSSMPAGRTTGSAPPEQQPASPQGNQTGQTPQGGNPPAKQ